MWLENLHIIGAAAADPAQVQLEGKRIVAVAEKVPGSAPALDLGNALAFPGLINSHDHLELNLFPLIRTRRYANYREWAADVQGNHQPLIRDLLRIPATLRYRWGLCKNLLAGVTTVVQHGRRYAVPELVLVDVHGPTEDLHSVAFERNWRMKLLRPRRRPVVMHLGEGTDETAAREVRTFLRWNRWRRTVAVHGIVLAPGQADGFAGVIWCPASNLALYGQTARVEELKKHSPVLFGTDSTLSAPWDPWDHLRQARNGYGLDDGELLAALTTTPARVWNLPDKGRIAPGARADLVVARRKGDDLWDAFYTLRPADLLLVVKDGRAALCDEAVFAKIKESPLAAGPYWPVRVDGRIKHLATDLPGLVRDIRKITDRAAFPIEC